MTWHHTHRWTDVSDCHRPDRVVDSTPHSPNQAIICTDISSTFLPGDDPYLSIVALAYHLSAIFSRFLRKIFACLLCFPFPKSKTLGDVALADIFFLFRCHRPNRLKKRTRRCLGSYFLSSPRFSRQPNGGVVLIFGVYKGKAAAEG